MNRSLVFCCLAACIWGIISHQTPPSVICNTEKGMKITLKHRNRVVWVKNANNFGSIQEPFTFNQSISTTDMQDEQANEDNENTNSLNAFLPFPSFQTGKPSIAIITFRGLIGFNGITHDSYRPLIAQTFRIPNLQAVLLNIDSAGGSATQSDLIVEHIQLLAAEHNVKVYSFVQDVAVSGGYWLACAGRNIYISKTSEIGSIGVISSSFGFENAIKSLNIERRITFAGDKKSSNDPFSHQSDDDKKAIKEKVTQIHEIFINHVNKSRGDRLNADNFNTLFSGSSWIGQHAVEMGLADEVLTMERFIQEKFGGPDIVNVVEYRLPPPQIQIFPASLPPTVETYNPLQYVVDGSNHPEEMQNFNLNIDQNKELSKLLMFDMWLGKFQENSGLLGNNEIQSFRSLIKMLINMQNLNQ